MGQNQATFFKSREQIVAATEPQHLLPVLFGCRKKKKAIRQRRGGIHPGEQTFLNNMHVLMSTEVKVDYDNALK